MKMFILKFILVCSLMFLSVLFGMQQAQEGIHRMKGVDDSNFKDALNVTENRNGEFEVSLLGNQISSHDLRKKKEQLEEMKAYNLFSSIGKKLAEGVSTLLEKMIGVVSSLLKG